MRKGSDIPATNAADSRLVFLVIAEQEAGKGVPYGFLENLEKAFFKQFDPRDTDFAHLPPYGCASFNSELKKMMQHQGGTVEGQEDALRATKREINDVREVMTVNIERLLERGEHMNVLVDKTSRLGDNARDFRVRSRTLKRRMWWKNVKVMALICLAVLILIYLFVGFGCGLPGKSSPPHAYRT
jgi:vesicle-associated membrane protein 7